MSVKYAILATEGADDQAVLCSFLRHMQFKSFNYTLSEIEESFWNEFVPRFPQATCVHAQKNHAYPYIFRSADYQVAVYQGKGSNLAQGLLDRIQNNPKYKEDICALGIVVDADSQQPTEAAKTYADLFRDSFPTISATPGTITPDSPRTGIYVWPDNQNSGTIETLLLDCASFVHPDHKAGAERFINELNPIHKRNWNRAKSEKALIASIVSVLRPGQANNASFSSHKDKWVGALTLEKVAGLEKFWIFLHNLLDIALVPDVSEVAD